MTAAIYYWLPKWCGRMYNESMGKTHFWISFIGFNLTFFPQHFVGLGGHAASNPGLRAAVRGLQYDVQIGAFIYGASQILFLYNVIATIVPVSRLRMRRSGKALKVWSGLLPRRRPTTPLKHRRGEVEAHSC